MLERGGQEPEDVQRVSRRDFLKICSSVMGGLALPRSLRNTIEAELPASRRAPFNPQTSFQWQNEFLCQTIYPMREQKLRDVLIYYMEVDVWAQYKDKDVSDLKEELYEYKKGWEDNVKAAQQEYTWLRKYFQTMDVRGYYANFHPIDEAQLTEINNLHALFKSWPKDIRGERSFLEGAVTYWKPRIQLIRDWIKSRARRHQAMNPAHPKYASEGQELEFKVGTTLPMAEQELDRLRAFQATYDKLEERKFAWYKLSKSDPNFKTPEAAFIMTYPAEKQITVRDIAYWKVEEYTKSLAGKNQYELLDMINQRFRREPKRYPPWLQYMIVHFSGMRYASAHGSWADARDLVVRLRAQKIEEAIAILDDAKVESLCKEKVAAYESPAGKSRPKLAAAQEKEWREKIGWYLPNLKAAGPKTRRQGLLDLTRTEDAYEVMSQAVQAALAALMSMKATFPAWAWKEIVKLTPLRVTEVSDLGWETLTPEETEERNADSSRGLRAVMNEWEKQYIGGWRDEHGRTQEVIVTRLVCNETAEHCQHIRGHLPPGGLAAKPRWYVDAERKLPGAYYVRPTSEKDYTQGASILWLRFVSFSSSNPNEWQIAKWVETKQNVGLLPAAFTKKGNSGGWTYNVGDVTTRSRTTVTADKQQVVENQWLRWIHEATVAEVAETADGMTVLTYETALPGGDKATSAVGLFKASLQWHLSDGTEDQFNRSFVGYIPEGEVPVEHLKTMLDWDRIFRK